MSEILGAAVAGHDEGLGNSASENSGASADEVNGEDSPANSSELEPSPKPPPALLGESVSEENSAALSKSLADLPAPESLLTVSATRITPSAFSTASCCSGDQSGE
jgi:hypothetical protein